MNAPKSRLAVTDDDPAVAAFDRACGLDEPLSPEEIVTIEERIAGGNEGISSHELLARLRPKP